MIMTSNFIHHEWVHIFIHMIYDACRYAGVFGMFLNYLLNDYSENQRFTCAKTKAQIS